MNPLNTSATLVSLCALMSGLVACGDTSPESGTATVQGKIEASGETQADAVIATQHDSDGNETIVSIGDAVIAADGSYTLSVEIPDPSAGPLVLTAESGGEARGSALVSLGNSPSEIIVAPPINTESSVETDIYVDVGVSIDLDTSEIAALKLLVDDTLAAAVASSNDYAADVQATADGVAAASLAFEQALEARAEGEASALLTAANEEIVIALAELDRALHEASTAAEAEAAADAYVKAHVEAYANAGFDEATLATAALAAIDGMEHYVVDHTASAKAAAAAHANLVFAAVISQAVETRMEAAGMAASSLTTAADARAQLEAEIRAAKEEGDDAAQAIAEAWATYSAAIEAEIEGSLELGTEVLATLKAGMAQAEQDLDGAIDDASGSASTVAATLADAHVSFYGTATAQTETTLLTAAGMTDAEASATVSILATLSVTDG